MVDPVLVEKAMSLSVEERLELIGRVWDSIDHAARPVSPSVAALVEERVADATANPLTGRPWDEVRHRLRERRGR
ncbi:addiction module protein [Nocardioides sp. LHD-245]|uniref:addiction module protein n=1 Tax=Nocardioides sp. LHD-245 TaxID=3051387 RepID=UPI0027DF2B8A|nr:addiction module protein [Nocardioides sp. LHD-245]